MKCPKCEVTLVMSDRQGVEIDYCPQCRGIWLDRGEIDKIIERSLSHQAPQPPTQPNAAYQQSAPPPPRYEDRDYRYHDKYKYKKKSWLSEFFD
jgi:hypothetical protein